MNARKIIDRLQKSKDKAVHVIMCCANNKYELMVFDVNSVLLTGSFTSYNASINVLNRWIAENAESNKEQYKYCTIADACRIDGYRHQVTRNPHFKAK
jgi:hypothetical protein